MGRNDLDARIYLAWIPRKHRAVLQKLGDSLSEEEIRARLGFLLDARLIAEMDGHYLSVAAWRNRCAREVVANAQVTQGLPESRSLLNVI
jgi:hypothetical protein